MSDKIQSQHLERKAILYVRQSSSFQVQHGVVKVLDFAGEIDLVGLRWAGENPKTGLGTDWRNMFH